MKKVVIPLVMALLAASTFGLAACNTVEGAGKDVKSTGNAIEDLARDAKPSHDPD